VRQSGLNDLIGNSPHGRQFRRSGLPLGGHPVSRGVATPYQPVGATGLEPATS
jgi:hypothetical protein